MSDIIGDIKIAYGARCMWWDSIDKVGHRGGLPCCPHCGNVLYEVSSEQKWLSLLDDYEAKGNPGYRAMWEWSRGKCIADMAALETAYHNRKKEETS